MKIVQRESIVVVITARLSSERLPRKVLEELYPGLTALDIQVHRAGKIGVPIVVSLPEGETELYDYACKIKGVDYVSMGNPNHIAEQIHKAVDTYNPVVIIRGLPDCPYFDYAATYKRAQALVACPVAWATRTQHRFGMEPLYGANEPVYSYEYLNFVRNREEDVEHFGRYIDINRNKVNILYTEALPTTHYRTPAEPFRLELDTQDDLIMLKRLMSLTGVDATPDTAAWVLRQNPSVAKINAHIEEKTGPVTSYKDFMADHDRALKDSHAWNGHRISLSSYNKPVFCGSGTCFLGYVDGNALMMTSGQQIRNGFIHCQCGVGRMWHFKGK